MLNSTSSARRALTVSIAAAFAALPLHGFAAMQSRAQIDAAHSAPQSMTTTTALTADTRSCELWYFGNLPNSKCMRFSTATPGAAYAGAMGNQTPHCPTIPVGQVTSAVTAPTGGFSCFQFVTAGAATMPVEVSLPSNVTGMVELFVVYPNGGGFKVSEARTGTPLALNFSMSAAQRIGVIIRPFSGPGGQNMNIGVNIPAPAAPTSLNDTANTSTNVPMNRGLNSTITTPGSSNGYYFYPLDTGEAVANYNIVRTANQTVGVRPAQRIAPNVYALSAETIVPASNSGKTISVTSANTNTAGTTTPHGFMVRVSGTNAAAPVDEPYSVRLSGGRNYIFQTVTANTENISRWYPISGAIQVATYLTVTAKIKDAVGNFVPNEPVTFDFVPNLNAPGTVQTLSGVTDEYGVLTVSATFPACSGTTISATNYGPPSTPGDKWNGTAQRGNVLVKVNGVNPPAGYQNQTNIPFTRICSETYLGIE